VRINHGRTGVALRVNRLASQLLGARHGISRGLILHSTQDAPALRASGAVPKAQHERHISF